MHDSRSLLQTRPILTFLPGDVRSLVLDCFVPVSFVAGACLMREGDALPALYVVISGEAQVVTSDAQGRELVRRVLRAGDSIGEMEFLEELPAPVTVRAQGAVEALKLERSAFTALLEQHADIRTHVGLESQRRRLHSFFRLYSPFPRLPQEALYALLSKLEAMPVPPGKLVVRQGDEPGPLYVVEAGQLRVFVDAEGKRYDLGYLGPGDFFGEIAMFKASKRTASVEAVSPCRVLACPETLFRELLEQYPDFKSQIEAHIAGYESV
jgi:CRP-like cAMP-binding protein